MRGAGWIVAALALGASVMATAERAAAGVEAQPAAMAAPGDEAAQGAAADRGMQPQGTASAAPPLTRLASNDVTAPKGSAGAGSPPAAPHGAGMAATGTPANDTGADLPTAPADLPAFLRQADAWLLSGRDLPPELPRLLVRLGPADRLTAIAYLRRLGLLDTAAMPLEQVLAPAEEPGA